MYGNPYINTYNPQSSIDRINTQIAELEKLKSQIPQTSMQQPTNLTQNFQIAPNNNDTIKYANSIDDVKKYSIMGDTPYFSKDMSVVWVKNTNGDIKAYELNEIVEKDEKDLQIEFLQAQIDELKKGLDRDEQLNTNVDTKQIPTDTTKYDEPIREPVKKSKSTSVQKISRSKKEQ